jgi:DNA-directed RNA polymerase subunit RPC12/RpoP
MFVESGDSYRLLPDLPFINQNSIIAAIVVIILINLAASQTVKAEKKKYGNRGNMLCMACQGKVKVEQEQAHLAAVAESEKWIAELKVITDNDPVMATIVKDWRAAHADAVPSRENAANFRTAINMERAGNFEGAAQIYEAHKLFTQAGKAREKNRMQTVKHVTLDMNQLIEQIGTKGLAIPYKCHNCGASITIDKNSSVSGLKFCSYCGSTYNIEDMSKIVQEALSY